MRADGARSTVLLLLTLAAGCGESARGKDVADEVSPLELLREDRRIATLFAECKQADARFYDRDTSQPIEFLVDKLLHGEHEPLQRAKEELAALGDEALVAVRRLFEEHSTSRFGAPYLENAVDVAGLSRSPLARAILLAGLDQPQESVRLRSLRSLAAGHGRPEDYELLRNHLDLERDDVQIAFALALHDVDPPRAELEYLDWLRSDRYPQTWRHVLPSVAESGQERVWHLAAEVYERAPRDLQPWLVAAAAKGEPETYLPRLRGNLDAESRELRTSAVRAVAVADFHELLPEVLRRDPDPILRGLALEGLAEIEQLDERELGWVREALDDPSPSVRGSALSLLVREGDPMAVDRALNDLGQTTFQVEEGLTAMRETLGRDPELARRVLEILKTRLLLESGLPPTERAATYKALGLVPGREPARILREEGLALQGVELEGLRAHRWLMIQASNTGEEGQAYLFERLRDETDPLRRLDLLHAGTSSRSDAVRERLMAFLAEGPASSLELLFAASQLCKIGPGARVAPFLKRLSYELEDPEVRPALQCLLWRWY